MKSLAKFINEQKEADIQKDIENFAWGIIDQFNQDGTVGFSETDWKDYIDGSKEPDYKMIVDEILAQYKEYAGTRFGKMYETPTAKKAIEFLKKYESNKDDINVLILRAGKKYIENI